MLQRRNVHGMMTLTLGVHSALAAPPTRHNVLYIVYDDLRPDLSLYNLTFMHTPHLQKLADSGTVFDRAYCQQTVCAPSRMSFTTGRRPNSTKTWNFLNHFRQAECSMERGTALVGTPLTSRPPAAWGCATCAHKFPTNASRWGFHDPGNAVQSSGGAAGCCTDCTSAAGCSGWVYKNHACTLLASITGRETCVSSRDSPCLSGTGAGSVPTWTTLPQSFKAAGYNVLGAGKYFHDGDGGLGTFTNDGRELYPGGTGAPPQQDPTSWTPGLQQFPNLTSEYGKFGYFQNSFDGSKESTGGIGFAYVDAQDELCRAHKSRTYFLFSHIVFLNT